MALQDVRLRSKKLEKRLFSSNSSLVIVSFVIIGVINPKTKLLLNLLTSIKVKSFPIFDLVPSPPL